MVQGLPTSRLINVSLSLSALGVGFANLNSACILGGADIVDATTRIMAFNSMAQVAGLFTPGANEYQAAQAFFSQSPQPSLLYIGRWVAAPSRGGLWCGPLNATQQQLSNFTQFTTGGFYIALDALAGVQINNINLSGCTNLAAVASTITSAMASAGVACQCKWTGTQFVFRSTTTGVASKCSFLSASGSGQQGLYIALAGSQALGARQFIGAAAETPLAAVQALDNLGFYYYALNTDACVYSTAPTITDADREAIAAYIEAASQTAAPHVYGFTCMDPNAIAPGASSDVGTVLHNSGYQRTFVQYSSTSQYAACSLISLFMTVDLTGNNTMITAAYKGEPGITPENLSSTQANELDASGYNYYSNFNNGSAVLVNGCMICTSIVPGGGSNEVYIDEMLGADGLCNAIQVDYFNLMAGVPKIPQTDAGSHLGANAIEQACKQFVDNGYLGPGQWNAGGFGQIANGSFLSKGYYIYTPPIISQAQADRMARKSVPYQVAAKTAGAIHTANIAVTVNP